MQGQVWEVSQEREWDFSYLAAGGSSGNIFLVKALPVVPYNWLGLFVRVHQISMSGSSSTNKITVRVNNVYPSSSDPQLFGTTGGGSIITTDIDINNSAGDVEEAKASAGTFIGPWVMVALSGSQDASAQETIAATLSIGLVGRLNVGP